MAGISHHPRCELTLPSPIANHAALSLPNHNKAKVRVQHFSHQSQGSNRISQLNLGTVGLAAKLSQSASRSFTVQEHKNINFLSNNDLKLQQPSSHHQHQHE
ncbi:hypothetical protein E2C01_051917 [Portunus trituberculatus]|uniref:Uncharacterized protein n=1 Tax=Portunus trituberculatus TaxID=210409 RepID=A0A5B7GKL5_PORTR|nr:hypothetical protein [Portunus trituberculatus]